MKMKNVVLAGVMSITVAGSLALFGQAPVVNIGNRHGNLRAAQQYIIQAYQKIESAQNANDYQLGGHAQRALDLLNQADAELRLAANVSNENGR